MCTLYGEDCWNREGPGSEGKKRMETLERRRGKRRRRGQKGGEAREEGEDREKERMESRGRKKGGKGEE